MKNKVISIVVLLLISVFMVNNVYATEEQVSDTTVVEQVEQMKTIEAEAIVLSVGETKQIETGGIIDTVQEVKLKILNGKYKGEEITTNYVLSYDIEGKILAYELEENNKVMINITPNEDGTIRVSIENVVRQNYMLLMVLVFFASIVLIGGKKGIKAIIGLIITILAVYFILIKSIYLGRSPIIMSVLTSAIITGLTLTIICGFNKKVLTATLGTWGGIITAGIFATIFSYLTKLSGACEDAVQLSINASNITFDFRELIFAGIIISALGACMDVGMSIASSLDEIKSKTPDITAKELFKSGMNIGKDVIGTMCNTLILAYVGGALTLIILFMVCDFGFVQILNKETIAEEIISAVAGSMGVLYTVPITAFIYSFLNRDKVIYKKTSENKIDGKRSLKL